MIKDRGVCVCVYVCRGIRAMPFVSAYRCEQIYRCVRECVCVNVHVCVCVYLCVRVHMGPLCMIRTSADEGKFSLLYIYTCLNIHIYTTLINCEYPYIYIYEHKSIYILNMYLHIYIYVFRYIYICIFIHFFI